MNETQSKVKSGLRGWLLLIGMGLVYGPIHILEVLLKIYPAIFKNGTLEALTTSGSKFYHPFWAPYIFGEIVFNAVILLASFYLIYLFFSKKLLFPKLYIYLTVGSMIGVIIDTMLIKVVLPNKVIFDLNTLTPVAETVLKVLIFVPYITISKRVKATFLN